MQVQRLTLAIISLAAIITLTFHYPALAQSGDSTDELALSPYWSYAVARWEPIILQEAERRNLDPDLIAALIWKESQGRSTVEGPAGAVGLMMVMPFSWRPSPEELVNPWTNMFWGARVLATVIQDGRGDLYYSLAAYNGSWEQIHLGVTRRYAASILDSYARAVAVRRGLPEDGDWFALFGVEGAPGPRTTIVLGPQRPLARYTERPWGQADIPMAPSDTPPHATAITFTDEQGIKYQVNVWLIMEDSPATVIPYAEQSIFLPPPASYGRNGRRAASEPHFPTTRAAPPPAPTVTPTPPGVTPTLTLTPTFTVAATPTPALTPTSTVTLTPPTLTPTPPATATITLTPTIPADCQGGPLRLEAWYLDRVYNANGWTATIFAEGYGGNCIYTYAWNGETKSGPMSGSTTFEIDHTDPFAVIIGTVSMTSAGETVEVGLFIKPPGDD
ncbi:MAG: lytic transglycosylase domain-containing protein [Chloroflexota bacterium]|nr:lytic transglycosylase domain-containing protein [Chloroflexota bacterium]